MERDLLHPVLAVPMGLGLYYCFYRVVTTLHDRQMRDFRGEGTARQPGGNGVVKLQAQCFLGLMVFTVAAPFILRCSDVIYEIEEKYRTARQEAPVVTAATTPSSRGSGAASGAKACADGLARIHAIMSEASSDKPKEPGPDLRE